MVKVDGFFDSWCAYCSIGLVAEGINVPQAGVKVACAAEDGFVFVYDLHFVFIKRGGASGVA